MFFKSIEQHLDNLNLNIVITKNENGLVVSVLPQLKCKDEAKSNITPILLKGTADELDAQFIGIIQQPLEKVSGVSSNLIQFEKSIELAESKSAITKAEKIEETKMKEKADKCLKKADEFIEKDDVKKAILQIEAALKFSPNYKKAKDMLVKHKSEATGMFEESVISEIKQENKPNPAIIENVHSDEGSAVQEIVTEQVEKVLVEEAEKTAEETKLPKVAVIKETPIEIEKKVPMTVIEDVVYDKVDDKGKPQCQDLEPITNYDERLTEFEAESPLIIENPAATNSATTPVEEVKSDMQEMIEQETADKEMEAMLKDVSKVEPEIKVEPKEETPKAASDNKYEILG